MPRRKVVQKKAELSQEVSPTPVSRRRGSRFALLILVLLLLVGLYLWKNKAWVVVGTVDGVPIWRPAFEQRLLSQNGTATLNSMIDEQIVLNEAKKRNIVVTPEELNAEIDAIKKTLPAGTTLDQALAERKLTLEDVKQGLTVKIIVQKLINSMPKPSTAEIAKYLEANKDYLTATDSAGQTQEAVDALLNEKFKQAFQDWQKKAKVQSYL